MNLNIRFKGFEASDAVKHYLEERSGKLFKFLPPTTVINATLKDDKVRKVAEITLRHKGLDYVGKQESESMMNSIDDAVDKLIRQLARAKGKKQNRSGVPIKEMELEELSEVTE